MFSVPAASRLAAITVILSGIVIFPIPYGAVLPGGKFLIQAVAFAALLLAALDSGRAPLGRARWAILPIVLVALLGAVQLAPLPDSLLSRLSPASLTVWQQAGSSLTLFGKPAPAARISIAPPDTITTTLLTLAYASLFFAAAAAFDSRNRRRLFAATLLAAAVAHLGIAGVSGKDLDRVHGAFINPNHLAGYLEIALAVAFGAVLSEILTGGERSRRAKDDFERIYLRWTPVAWRVVVWGVIAIGIALTKSRGGIVAAAFSTALMVVMAFSGRHVRHRRAFAWAGIVSLAGGLSIVALTTGKYPLLRFLTSDPRDAASDMRVQLWRLSLDAWKQFPVFGSGLGTFREAFRRIQPEDMNMLVEQAHNDSLQLLVTGGVVGLCLAAAGLLLLVGLFGNAWARQHHREESAWALAGLGALLSLLFHGLVEFNFSIPAIPATLAMTLGVAWSAARTDLEGASAAPSRPVAVAPVAPDESA